jgi:hypothetical protein
VIRGGKEKPARKPELPMGFMRYCRNVFQAARSHSLDIAQAAILILLIAVGPGSISSQAQS